MTATMTATEAIKRIQTQAERIKSDDTQRFSEAASANDGHRQGDVYIKRIDAVPAGCSIVENPSLQMAPGTTQGSRHILDSLGGVKVYARKNPGMLDGPILEIGEQERTLTHPEHGDVVMPCGVYEITYQQNLDQNERAARVLD